MKNYKILAAIAALTMAMNAKAVNTICIGDTFRISPKYLDGYVKVLVRAEFDGMADSFTINATYPQGLSVKLVNGITPSDGMGIRYMRADGTEITEVPMIECAAKYAVISATSTYQGYWDYNEDGILECYGTAKWMPGRHDFFYMNLYVAPYFDEGNITFDGIITSGPDQRGAVLQGVRFYKKTHFWVGYRRGDVTGNDRLTIDDVTDLIDLLIGVGYHDEYQIAAADFDRSGEVDIADVTKLLDNIER